MLSKNWNTDHNQESIFQEQRKNLLENKGHKHQEKACEKIESGKEMGWKNL